jgi:hypothetical protein
VDSNPDPLGLVVTRGTDLPQHTTEVGVASSVRNLGRPLREDRCQAAMAQAEGNSGGRNARREHLPFVSA